MEKAFFSLPPGTTELYKFSRKNSEKQIYKLLERPRRTLATILFAKIVSGLLLIACSLFCLWHFTGSGNGWLTFLVILALFFAIIFITEVLPKVYYTNHPFGLSRSTAHLLEIIRVIFSPFTFFYLTLETGIYQRFNLKNGRSTIEDLQEAIDEAIPEESSEEQKEILKGLVSFGSISVKQIMRARVDITAFDNTLTFAELIPLIGEWGYSRVPVYRENLDEIEGILYIKDLLPYLEEQPENFNWQKLIRPPFFVPESKKIDDLLKDFQEMHVHMAMVVDEYGGTSGLITLEDIIEEIVGDIKDEFDDEDELVYSRIDDNRFIFDAKTSLYNFCKITGTSYEKLEAVKGENETLAGLMLELFSRIPRSGAKAELLNYRFVIDSADTKKVKSVLVHVLPDKATPIV